MKVMSSLHLRLHHLTLCIKFPSLVFPDHFKVILKEVMPWREVPIVGLAALETGDELDNSVRLHTQKLTAHWKLNMFFHSHPQYFSSPQSMECSILSELLKLRFHSFSRTQFCRQMLAKMLLRN